MAFLASVFLNLGVFDMNVSQVSIPRLILLATTVGLLFPQPGFSIQFRPPGDVAPTNSLGGGVRGKVQFSVSGDAAPNRSVGGGVRGRVQFTAPGEAAPSSSVGGGTRGKVKFTLPGQSAPQSSASGGVRGSSNIASFIDEMSVDEMPADSLLSLNSSVANSLPLALLPQTGVVGRTVSSHPTFFAYLPPSPVREVFFSIQDTQGNSIYHATLPVSGDKGILAITLPAEAPALEVDENYVWFLAAIEANDILRPDSVGTIGWVKRVSEDSVSGVENATSNLDRATAYAAAGIWYDTLSLLAPQDTAIKDAALSQEWTDLLTQVGLENLVGESVTAL